MFILVECHLISTQTGIQLKPQEDTCAYFCNFFFYKFTFFPCVCPENSIHLGLSKLQTSLSSNQHGHCAPLGLPCLQLHLEILLQAESWGMVEFICYVFLPSGILVPCCFFPMSENSYFTLVSSFSSASLEPVTLKQLEREIDSLYSGHPSKCKHGWDMIAKNKQDNIP